MAGIENNPDKDNHPDVDDGTGDASDEDEMDQQGNEQDWDDWEASGSEGGDEPTASLFEPGKVLATPDAALDYDARQHGFHLLKLAKQASLDDYSILRLVNYIRGEVKAGRDPRSAVQQWLQQGQPETAPWSGDQYLIPVLPEDPLLCYDFEEALAALGPVDGPSEEGLNSAHAPDAASSSTVAKQQHQALQQQVTQLQRENDDLRELLSTLRLAAMPEELQAELLALQQQTQAGGSSDGASTSACTSASAYATGQKRPYGSGAAVSGSQQQEELPGSRTAAVQEVDNSYFDSYSGFGIHQEMLSDKPRTEAYRQALECNPSLIRGKTVLDVGCGTSILSMFAARGGAAAVVGVDGSERIAGFARQVANANKLGRDVEGPVRIVSSRIEELQSLPDGIDKVDVIVSEWMGYALLFETMLDSVLAARDRWLRPGGVVLPDIATIYVAGATAGALGLDFWNDVYGFDMRIIGDDMRKAQQAKANVLEVKSEQVVTEAVAVKVLDLCTMQSKDQDFTAEFMLTLKDTSTTTSSSRGAGLQGTQEVAAVVLWFDTLFSKERCPDMPVTLSTSPHAPITHWAQTVLPLRTPVLLGSQPGQATSRPYATEIKGRLSMARNKAKHRSLDIALTYQAHLSDGTSISDTKVFPMSVVGKD